jgi:hypothetical protein
MVSEPLNPLTHFLLRLATILPRWPKDLAECPRRFRLEKRP